MAPACVWKMSCPVSRREIPESETTTLLPEGERTTRRAGSRVCTRRSLAGSNVKAIGAGSNVEVTGAVVSTGSAIWPLGSPRPHPSKRNTVSSPGCEAFPGATAAIVDPSGEIATSTGRTAGNETLTSGDPWASSTVSTPATADGPHKGASFRLGARPVQPGPGPPGKQLLALAPTPPSPAAVVSSPDAPAVLVGAPLAEVDPAELAGPEKPLKPLHAPDP